MVNFNFKRHKKLYDQICDKLLTDPVTSTAVRLFYPPIYVECNNCIHSDYGITYRNGGPAPFHIGSCPMCGGNGNVKQKEVYKDIRLRVYSIDSTSFSKTKMRKMGITVDHPEGDLLSIGFQTDLNDIQSCNYAIIYNDFVGHDRIRYKVSSEVRPHGFSKDRYFFCFWSRI